MLDLQYAKDIYINLSDLEIIPIFTLCIFYRHFVRKKFEKKLKKAKLANLS